MSNGRSSRTREEHAGRPVPTLVPENVPVRADQPRQLIEAELALAISTAPPAFQAATVVARPTLEPPGAGPAADPAGAAAFQSVRVLALFSSTAHANGWAFLEGVGWQRIATTNDSAHATLGLLAGAARIAGTVASVRRESDNQIHEVYVW
jgi:hypothetical protein